VSFGENIFRVKVSCCIFAKRRNNFPLPCSRISSSAFLRRGEFGTLASLKLFSGLFFEWIQFFSDSSREIPGSKLDKHIQDAGEERNNRSLKSGMVGTLNLFKRLRRDMDAIALWTISLTWIPHFKL